MPHAELKYSSNLKIDAPSILTAIEAIILKHDSKSGECKGRAYPADQFHHTHLIVEISMLTKSHRDAEFTQKLVGDLERGIKALLLEPCFFSLALNYSAGHYVTNFHDGAET